MKEVKELFSKISNALKPFFQKVKSVFKLVNNILKNSFKKIGYKYKKVSYKNKYIEPIVVIGTSCLSILILILGIKNFTSTEEVNITNNTAEYLYYENKYDESIEEYKKMQESDTWPIWTVKIADIYSLQGETTKSNTLLREALVKRDKIIKDEGYEKYKEKDIELISSMLYTFTLNKEYGDVISFGEQYINEYGKNKDILKILFIAYIENNYEYKVEELLDTYPLDEKSSNDIATLANMNMLTNRWDDGIDLLKDAWNLDKNELKIYNVINSMYLFDKDSLITTLENKIKESDEESYKVFLAKAYAMDKDSTDEALNLVEDLDNNIGTDIIKYDINKTLKDEDEADNYLADAINKSKSIDKESYSTYYLLSLRALNSGNFDEALTYAKKSINANSNNCESFGILIPEILISKKDFKSVLVYYREAMKKEPYNYEVIINLAKYYTSYVSNDEKSRQCYESAISLRKDDSSLYKKIVDLDIKDGNYNDAIENIKEAIKIDENKQEYYRTLGALYLTEGMNEEGIEITRKAYSMDEKDVASLNNAAWYYLTVEKDIERGYENLKSAYSDMPAGLDEETKNIIIDNYKNTKKVYDEYAKGNTEEINITGLKLIY